MTHASHLSSLMEKSFLPKWLLLLVRFLIYGGAQQLLVGYSSMNEYSIPSNGTALTKR